MLTWLLHFNDCLAQVWPRSLLQQYYTRLSLFQAVSRRIAWRCWRKVWLPNFLYETTNLVTTSFMEIHDFQLEMHQLRLFFIPISSSAPMWWWCFSSSFLRGCWAFDVPAHQDITREMESFYVFLKNLWFSSISTSSSFFWTAHQFGIWTTNLVIETFTVRTFELLYINRPRDLPVSGKKFGRSKELKGFVKMDHLDFDGLTDCEEL